MADKSEQSGKQRSDGEGRRGDKDGKGEHHATVLERIMGLVGAVIVLGVIGFMLYEAIWGEQSPPNVQVELVRVVPNGEDYLAEVRVRNIGGDTAAGVAVTGKLVPPGIPEANAESVTLTIDYVPPDSTVQVGMFFDSRPTRQTLQLSAGGYVQP